MSKPTAHSKANQIKSILLNEDNISPIIINRILYISTSATKAYIVSSAYGKACFEMQIIILD